MVVAVVALITAASGTAYAGLLGNDTVGSAQVINGSLRSIDIGQGQVRSVDIAQGEVRGVDIAGSTIQREDLNNTVRSDIVQVRANDQVVTRTPGVLAGVPHLPGTNSYIVRFVRDVRDCAWIVSASDTNAVSQAYAQATLMPNTISRLVVHTFAPGSGFAQPVESGFHLAVICSG